MWEAIKYFCDTGAKILHFGRTSPTNYGLRRFKLGWGSQEGGNPILEVPRQLRVDQCPTRCRSPGRFLFRRLPSVVARWAGGLLYPHLDCDLLFMPEGLTDTPTTSSLGLGDIFFALFKHKWRYLAVL